MARIRILTDDEYRKKLASQFMEAKQKADKLKVEYEIGDRAYQCISEGVQAGLDAGLATQYLFTSMNNENVMPMIEGLDLIKAVFFLHSKLCISDPVVQMSPRKQDTATKRAAEIAQAYLPYMRQRMHMQERLEAGAYLNLCIYGNGITYNGWDENGGEFPLDQFPDNQADMIAMMEKGFKMEGDYDFHNVHPTKFFPDAAPDNWLDCLHCFEEFDMNFEEAMYTYSGTDQQNMLREHHNRKESKDFLTAEGQKDTVKLYYYHEVGKPWNGFLGSKAIILDPENPKILYRGGNPFPHKKLPYNFISDIDVPGNVMGMSRIVYGYRLQMCINNLMYLINKNIALFGGNKMLLPEGSINEDVISNAIDDVAFFNPATGGKPEYIRPANVTTDVWRAYDIMKAQLNNLYGMNEFSQGQIPRELSAYAVQSAMEMDDKYRIRLFNKKKLFLKDIYYQGLENTKEFMQEPRRLNICGIEQFTNDGYFMASSLEGDYDQDVDYGPYLPVDPAARKTQILEFIKSGFFEKAGGNMRKAASLLIDGSMLDIKQEMEQSNKRQLAEIDRMINGEDVGLNPWDSDEDHAGVVEEFSRSATFDVLPIDMKMKIWKHGESHVKRLAEKIAKQQQAAPGSPPPGGPGGQPAPGMPPPPAGGTPPKPPSPVEQPQGPIV